LVPAGFAIRSASITPAAMMTNRLRTFAPISSHFL
jgi:hypothetical protein